MGFYKILPAAVSYKASEPLTYSSERELATGQIVSIPLKNDFCIGLVVDKDTRPNFRVKAVESISSLPQLPDELTKLAQWMIGFYSSGAGPILRQLVSDNLVRNNTRAPRYQPEHMSSSKLPPLTDEQKFAIDQISDNGTYLLHGETGTGKTRIYLELTTRALSAGESAIILTPEIGLTTQLASSFENVFGNRVITIHSDLTLTERRKRWQEILMSPASIIVIGPRSALFAPLKNVGLIAIDESHDSSYKQDDTPHYSSSTVAAKLASLHHCPLLLGSATPSVQDYFLAQSRNRPILRLTKLAMQSSASAKRLDIVDIKDRSLFKRSKFLSDSLIQSGTAALERGEQMLLFINRRGSARTVICSNCGWTAKCPNCDLPLTYHADSHNLRCHSCDYKQLAPTACPICSGNDLSFRGAGTKTIEAEAHRLFPKASISRFDNDNLKHERLEKLYSQVKSGKINIIIGTQTVAKGLDLPKLTVVGVIVADTGLSLPDFTANERTYQLIRQVIGRVGRGHRDGRAIIQTYHPDSELIKTAVTGDYITFYNKELSARQKYHFPPARHLLKLVVSRANAKSAETASEKLRLDILKLQLDITIDGPAPSFYEHRSGKYSWQLVVKSSSRSELLKITSRLPSGVAAELDPISLL